MAALAALLVLTLLALPAGMALAQDQPGDAAAGAGILAGGMVCLVLYLAVIVAFLVFWIMMLVDCIKREEAQFPNSTGNSKTLWLVLILLIGGIGAPAYYFMIKRKAPLS